MFRRLPVITNVVARGLVRRAQSVSVFQPRAIHVARRAFSTEEPPKSEAAAASKGESSQQGSNEPEDPILVLQRHNKKLEEEVKALKDKLLRSYAEEENVRRIAQRDVNSAKDYANTKFAKSLLDVADNLERAIDAIDHDQRTNADPHFLNLLQGVEMTQKGLQKVFNEHGIIRVFKLIYFLIFIVYFFPITVDVL